MPGRRGLQICSVLKKEENPCFASGNYYYYYYYFLCIKNPDARGWTSAAGDGCQRRPAAANGWRRTAAAPAPQHPHPPKHFPHVLELYVSPGRFRKTDQKSAKTSKS